MLRNRITIASFASVLLVIAVAGNAQPGGFLFWTDRASDTIRRSDLDGSGAIDIAAIPNENHTIHVDPAGQKLYWVASTSGTIRRSNFDGSAPETVIAGGTAFPRELFVDSPNDKMYWVEQTSGKLRRANLAGSAVVDLATGLDVPYGIAADVARGKLYWTVGTTLGGTADGVWQANLDGSDASLLRLSGGDGIHGVEVDPTSGRISWGVALVGPVGEIQQVNPDGSAYASLILGGSQTDFRHLALDVVNQQVYFDDLGTRQIYRLPYGGGVPQAIVTAGDPHSVAVFIPEPGAALFALASFFTCSRDRAGRSTKHARGEASGAVTCP